MLVYWSAFPWWDKIPEIYNIEEERFVTWFYRALCMVSWLQSRSIMVTGIVEECFLLHGNQEMEHRGRAPVRHIPSKVMTTA